MRTLLSYCSTRAEARFKRSYLSHKGLVHLRCKLRQQGMDLSQAALRRWAQGINQLLQAHLQDPPLNHRRQALDVLGLQAVIRLWDDPEQPVLAVPIQAVHHVVPTKGQGISPQAIRAANLLEAALDVVLEAHATCVGDPLAHLKHAGCIAPRAR